MTYRNKPQRFGGDECNNRCYKPRGLTLSSNDKHQSENAGHWCFDGLYVVYEGLLKRYVLLYIVYSMHKTITHCAHLWSLVFSSCTILGLYTTWSGDTLKYTSSFWCWQFVHCRALNYWNSNHYSLLPNDSLSCTFEVK